MVVDKDLNKKNDSKSLEINETELGKISGGNFIEADTSSDIYNLAFNPYEDSIWIEEIAAKENL